ncbi:GvpL/GvpF family gas vesicle protein [Stackebrandtia nassauensis]|uniref:Gas vesicle synthesis GvpLGvpF n=1 Tax=Stackebrandtia nassauensis (strain DSM 44728 / CIP 108903 / NRRL B-16338 / NBRC 102104 / LLR-40K-21) TaxID=446470 RepID=D3Q7K2_STANL|nr:GvpL/GvpF family gas vesicle protein [Stackebrandtia nassauensis]ADD44344.1 Gas vesicle synthesis GvpLGvpF [Stackebrandtia nassauensis DSM 44728]
MTEHTGLWLYAVADQLPDGRLPCPAGIDEAPVEAIAHDGLAAVVSPVDLHHYGEEALARRLEDFDWLAATANRHHAVIEAVHHLSTTVPMRLATVYTEPRRVSTLLAEQHDLLRRALDSVAGHTEWGVKAFAVNRPQAPPAAGGEESGAAYLRRRRAELANADAVRQEVWDAAQHAFHELGLLAVAQRRHRPQDAKLTGKPEPMLLNGSFLVEDTEQDAFTKAVSTLTADHPELEIQLSGPWPPYSFAGLAVEA